MRWLEVRRHSLTKKGAARGRGSHLSAEGIALARLVGESLGPFARVVTSASPRAIETAVAMGFAVDDTVELPSGYVPGEVAHHDQWRWPRPYDRRANQRPVCGDSRGADAELPYYRNSHYLDHRRKSGRNLLNLVTFKMARMDQSPHLQRAALRVASLGSGHKASSAA